MTQYINLFNPSLQKQRDALTARVLLLLIISSISVLAVATFITRQQALTVERQVKTNEELLQERRNKLVILAKTSGTVGSNAGKEEITRAQSALAVRNNLLTIVESGELGKTTGFSEQLKALARQTTNGLWLTEFNIKSNDETTIMGEALIAQLLPDYLNRFNNEEVFKGTRFATVSINKSEEPVKNINGSQSTNTITLPPHIVFNLSTKSRSTEGVTR